MYVCVWCSNLTAERAARGAGLLQVPPPDNDTGTWLHVPTGPVPLLTPAPKVPDVLYDIAQVTRNFEDTMARIAHHEQQQQPQPHSPQLAKEVAVGANALPGPASTFMAESSAPASSTSATMILESAFPVPVRGSEESDAATVPSTAASATAWSSDTSTTTLASTAAAVIAPPPPPPQSQPSSSFPTLGSGASFAINHPMHPVPSASASTATTATAAAAAAALLPVIATAAAAAAATAAVAPAATVAVEALSPRSLYQHLLHEIQVRAK
jgi:hypothetical protein